MFGALARIFPVKTRELEAKLTGVQGHTGYGEVEIDYWSNGRAQVEVELRGIAGLAADLVVAGRPVGTVPLDNGRADYDFDAQPLSEAFQAQDGDIVEIHQNGIAVLHGVLVVD
ncbi:MAG: hypothetical protein AAFR21_18115 [Pseudomonadota bacterium]